MTGASPRQLDVLRAISAYQAAKGFPITIRELCDELDLSSTNGVADHLRLLAKKGLITREKQLSRTLQLTAAGRREIGNGG